MPDIQIPREAVEAAATARYEYWRTTSPMFKAWDDLDDAERDEWMREEEIALRAGLRAWQNGMIVTEYFLSDSDHFGPALILPLPQEAGDE